MQRLVIHPISPQAGLVSQVVLALELGGVIAYPTDSAYALGCALGNKTAIARIKRMRNLEKSHNFTLICRDLSDIGLYAHVTNPVFRLLKAYTPGAYTFILKASREVPRRLQHPKRKTIGLRVPDHTICAAILGQLQMPLMSVSLILPEDTFPLSDPDKIAQKLHHLIDVLVDGGCCHPYATTVVDLTKEKPQVLRAGRADPTPFTGW